MNKQDYSIVTNNPIVKDKYKNTIFVEGDYREVLVKARDLVHAGHELINHPLAASIRMFFSPYRSIIVGNKINRNNVYHITTIESSIESYDKQMESRVVDKANKDDYSFIDEELLSSALEEFKRFNK